MSSHPIDRSNYAVMVRQLQALRREQQWVGRLLLNPNLTLSLRIALYALYQEIRGHPQNVDAEGFSQVYMPRLAELVGLSSHTVGRNLKTLAEDGNDILERKVDHNKSDAGELVKRVSFRLSNLTMQHPDQLTMKVPDNYGGKREVGERITCPHCGKQMPFKKSTRVHCTGCASEIEWMAEDAIINLPDDDAQAEADTSETIPDLIPPITTIIPGWLRIGTPEWEKLVKRVGLAEARERRQAWFDRLKEASHDQ